MYHCWGHILAGRNSEETETGEASSTRRHCLLGWGEGTLTGIFHSRKPELQKGPQDSGSQTSLDKVLSWAHSTSGRTLTLSLPSEKQILEGKLMGRSSCMIAPFEELGIGPGLSCISAQSDTAAVLHLQSLSSPLFPLDMLIRCLTKSLSLSLNSLCRAVSSWIWDSLPSASRVTGIMGLCHQTQFRL